MNIQQLKTHQKMLAVILGLAVIASVGGSMAYAAGSSQGPTPLGGSINLPQQILSEVKTPFTTAATTAAGQVPSGQVLSGGLRVIQGDVVYAFKVTNGTSVFSVIVDAGNGNVLKTSQGHPLTLASLVGGMGGHGMMMRGHMGMHGNWSKSKTSGSTTGTAYYPTGFQG